MSALKRNKLSEWSTETLGFPSTWRETRTSASKPVQTDEVPVKDQEMQCNVELEKAVQTDFEEVGEIDVNTMKPPYPPSLFAFFTKVTDDMCRALQENLDPFSAEVFKDCGDPDEFARASKASEEFTLRSANIPSSEEGFNGSCLAWNKRGIQIAVSYCASTHKTWCAHNVPISCWNLRRMFSTTENSAHVEIFLPSCVTAMEYHPFHPSVLAVGTFSGALAILDFSLVSNRDGGNKQGGMYGGTNKPFTRMGNNFGGGESGTDFGYYMTRPEHGLPITSVHWLKLNAAQSREILTNKKNENPSNFCIVTAGKEGHICLWSTNTSNTRVFMEKKFIVWADNISADVPLGPSVRSVIKTLGIVGISKCKDDPFTCVLATLGGFTFQVNLDSNVEAYTATMELETEVSMNDYKLMDPALVYVSQHSDCPVAVHCSPFHRDVFLIGSSDGKVHIQNMLQKGTMYRYDLAKKNVRNKTLRDAKWSSRPAMFAVVLDKLVHIFDLQKGQNPIATIPHEHDVTKIAWNEAEIGTLAACDIKGVLHIWNLPKKFSSQEPLELDVLMKSDTDSGNQLENDSEEEESENEVDQEYEFRLA